jgi:hypothetical protein
MSRNERNIFGVGQEEGHEMGRFQGGNAQSIVISLLHGLMNEVR